MDFKHKYIESENYVRDLEKSHKAKIRCIYQWLYIQSKRKFKYEFQVIQERRIMLIGQDISCVFGLNFN